MAFVRARCPECGEVFEAPAEYGELVVQGAVDCAEADREWRNDVVGAVS